MNGEFVSKRGTKALPKGDSVEAVGLFAIFIPFCQHKATFCP